MTDRNNRIQLTASLITILQMEFREGRWPQFLPEVLRMVQSQDHQTVYSGLAAFQELAKLYQYVLYRLHLPSQIKHLS